jgi:hypothetical protein
MAFLGVIVLYACVGSGPGSDFDEDGLKDSIEDRRPQRSEESR